MSVDNASPPAIQRRLLVLFISSDNFPGTDLIAPHPYPVFQQVWRQYMHLHREHIEAYFIRGDPDLPVPFEIRGDTIWCKTVENVMPGILNKTVLALEGLLPRIQQGEFQFILRTNLSSFFVFPRVLEFIQTLPLGKCYSASGGDWFGSGCGFFLSSDVAALLVSMKSRLLDVMASDDVTIAQALRDSGIFLLPAPRTDISSLATWNEWNRASTDCVTGGPMHFRVKNLHHELRATEDVQVYRELLTKYYHGAMLPGDKSTEQK
jgi:hypothetical protein